MHQYRPLSFSEPLLSQWLRSLERRRRYWRPLKNLYRTIPDPPLKPPMVRAYLDPRIIDRPRGKVSPLEPLLCRGVKGLSHQVVLGTKPAWRFLENQFLPWAVLLVAIHTGSGNSEAADSGVFIHGIYKHQQTVNGGCHDRSCFSCVMGYMIYIYIYI